MNKLLYVSESDIGKKNTGKTKGMKKFIFNAK